FDLSKVAALQPKPDPITAAVGAPTMVQAQLMTINEARTDYGLPALDDGDRLMTPDEIAALNPSPAAPTARHAGMEGRARSTGPDDRAARRARTAKRRDAQAVALERSWTRSLARLFRRQGRSAAARLEAKRGRSVLAGRELRAIADEVFDPQHWRGETT